MSRNACSASNDIRRGAMLIRDLWGTWFQAYKILSDTVMLGYKCMEF
nr:hypothetical protein [uncultured Campylobacter sp.]